MTMTAIDTTAIGAAPTPDPTVTEVSYPDVVILRLEIDDLCTLPHCSPDFVYNFAMAGKGLVDIWWGDNNHM